MTFDVGRPKSELIELNIRLFSHADTECVYGVGEQKRNESEVKYRAEYSLFVG